MVLGVLARVKRGSTLASGTSTVSVFWQPSFWLVTRTVKNLPTPPCKVSGDAGKSAIKVPAMVFPLCHSKIKFGGSTSPSTSVTCTPPSASAGSQFVEALTSAVTTGKTVLAKTCAVTGSDTQPVDDCVTITV